MPITYRRLQSSDLQQVRELWQERWAGDFVVAHGTIIYPEGLQGYVALDGVAWAGLITCSLSGGECEIVSLDGLQEGRGIGGRLIELAVDGAAQAGCRRVFLITTNDNLEALGFYQKRGFELVRIDRAALDRSRKLKPGIPPIGMHGIPLRDEIELEIRLP